MTPEINNDRAALLQGLNEDLAHEYQALLMYNSYAAMAGGIHWPFLRQFFEAELPEELLHAQFLADKIIALGGIPTTEPSRLKLVTEPRAMLEQVLETESETVNRYVERRRQAQAYGDYGLVADLDGIISDETKHKEETEKLLRHLAD